MIKTSILLLALFAPILAAAKDSPFACDRLALTPENRKRHFEELGPALRALRLAVRELPDGYEFKFPSDPKTLAMLEEWIGQERLCCPFFDFVIRIGDSSAPRSCASCAPKWG